MVTYYHLTSAISQSSSKLSPLNRGCGALAKYLVNGNSSHIAVIPSGYKEQCLNNTLYMYKIYRYLVFKRFDFITILFPTT